ncbi:MAG: orotidine-5'-phosphate decarboxylase [Anaerolineales bacterium]|nr:orotidine-5'-phosphate decarboxylase [Anaerolineales bacterium]
MPQTFFEKLEARTREVDSLLCVGLDPYPELLNQRTSDAMLEYCQNIIRQTADLAAAYKPNSAFFETFGPEGISVLQQVISSIPQEIPVLLDAKRGDIASTAAAYAQSVFETLGADAVTLSPYLGPDSIAPFLEDPTRGVFLLCKTSNPGASAFQDLVLQNGLPLYHHLAQICQHWGQAGQVGLVVGATQLESLAMVRAAAPDTWILAPGVGAQGGDLQSAIEAGLREDGMGLLVSVSRGIAAAADPRQAAMLLRDQINQARSQVLPRESRISSTNLILRLFESGCVQFGGFRLKSGLQSPIYIDLRRLISHPSLLSDIALAFQAVLPEFHFDRLAAIPYAALPIGTALSLQTGISLIYPRKETKEYGTCAQIEGEYSPGEQVLLLDDLATTGNSKFEMIEKLQSAGLLVKDILVLIDRQSGAREALEEVGVSLHALLTLEEIVNTLSSLQKITSEEYQSVLSFLHPEIA